MSELNISTPEKVFDNSFWALLREAFRGSNRDFTKGSISAAIILLAIPMIIEMFAESLFAIVDIFYVAKLGATAVAVVGITESLMYLVYAVAIGISVSATASVARRIGEKDEDGLQHGCRGAGEARRVSCGPEADPRVPLAREAQEHVPR